MTQDIRWKRFILLCLYQGGDADVEYWFRSVVVPGRG